MPRHSETRHLPYSPEQMFDLVADVGRYQEFLPWVAATRVRSNGPADMLADLVVGFGAFKETFTSRVTKQRPHCLTVDYVDGPLRHLTNDWTFAPDGKGGCKLSFCVDFAFRSRIFEAVAGQVFERALRRMTSAFESRADKLYGSGVSGISSSRAHSAA